MELKDFVAATITGIAQGIQKAQEEAGKSYRIAPRHTPGDKSKGNAHTAYGNISEALDCVEFDVAVTTSTSLEGAATAKIVVAEGNLNTQHEVTHLSRVRFQVYVDWPHPSAQ